MPLRASVNLTFLLKHLPEPKRRTLQRQSGVHVYPSYAEGFGHSLNEARAAAAVLVTTGGPPMNEFIEDGGSGILVPVRPENQKPYHRVTAYHVTADDLEQSIQGALQLSDEQRLTMGSRARARYEHDRNLFQAGIREFFTA
jgi:glycosyltransferase involved in cell wall biosynthesis